MHVGLNVELELEAAVSAGQVVDVGNWNYTPDDVVLHTRRDKTRLEHASCQI